MVRQPLGVVSHFRLTVTRFAETFAFYRDVIGLPTTHSANQGPYAEFQIGGDRYLALFERKAMADAAAFAPSPHRVSDDRFVLCIQVDDVDKAARSLQESGRQILVPPTDHAPWSISNRLSSRS